MTRTGPARVRAIVAKQRAKVPAVEGWTPWRLDQLGGEP